MFESHGIVQQQYHTRTLIGNHCKRLLNDHKEILSEIEAVFKSRELRRENIEDNVDEKIDSFISLMTKTLAKAHSIFRIMARIEHQHSDEECNDFELLVEQFGLLWRSPEFDQPAPCKFHGVEKHAPNHLRELRNLADLCEESAEEYHHEDKVASRIYAGIVGWEGKVKIALRRRDQKESLANDIKAHADSKKRKISSVTLEKKVQEKALKTEKSTVEIKESMEM